MNLFSNWSWFWLFSVNGIATQADVRIAVNGDIRVTTNGDTRVTTG